MACSPPASLIAITTLSKAERRGGVEEGDGRREVERRRRMKWRGEGKGRWWEKGE